MEDVALQLGISIDQLLSFQQHPANQEILGLLPKVEMENWELGAAANPQPLSVNSIIRVKATYDQKAVPGYGCANNLRAIMHINGEDKFLYGSSDREEGHIPPDISTLSILGKKQQKYLADFETVTDVFHSAKPGIPHSS
ncbi:MAG: hypothetical protein K2P93_06485 [Alphaproteobacteria bacterium]|nr:hypothetical protein [Alphaproteobacteria bacterium]